MSVGQILEKKLHCSGQCSSCLWTARNWNTVGSTSTIYRLQYSV